MNKALGGKGSRKSIQLNKELLLRTSKNMGYLSGYNIVVIYTVSVFDFGFMD